MKHKLLIAFLFIGILFSNKVMSQVQGQTECSLGSGYNWCTPNQSLTVVGFYPPYDSIPCVLDGVYFDTVVQFHAPSSDLGATINTITVKHIYNLPCGLCWGMGNNNNVVNGGQSGCVKVAGTTFDAPGQYRLTIYADIAAHLGIIPVNINGVNIDSLTGLKYFVRVAVPNGPCVTIDTNAVGNARTIPGAITTPSISGTTALCNGASTTLSVPTGYYGYVWSTGAITRTIGVSTAGTYTVTVYDNCASATASVSVTNSSGPTVTITPAVTSVCLGSSDTLTASGGNSYVWSNSQNTATIVVSPNTQTTYTVTVTGTGGCTATGSRTLTINTPPVTTVTATPDTICSGSNTLLSASGGGTYLWSNTATAQSIQVSPTSNTTYAVTVTDINTCTATATKTVHVNSTAVIISANGATSLCNGDSVTLTTDTTFTSYHWSVGATTRTLVVNTAGNYTITVTGANGCQGISNTINITVGSNLTPAIVANPSLNICPGGSTTLDAGSGFTTYAWSNSSGSESISVTTAGIYTVTVSSGACSGTATAQVNVSNFSVPVSVTPSGPVVVCTGDAVALDAGAGYASYNWNTGSTSEVVQPDSTGLYIVAVTKNSCIGSDTVQVTFKPLPTPDIFPPGPFTQCAGDTLVLDAGAGYASYLWSDGGTGESIQPTATGNYTVTVVQNGCQGVATAVSVTFNPLPTPTISANGSLALCTGQNVTLDAGAGYSAYLWSNGSTTETVNVDSAGSYNVTVTQNGCNGSNGTPENVTFNVTPHASLTDLGSASGFSVLQATPAMNSYTWLMQQSQNGVYTLSPATGQYDTVVCGSTAVYYTVVITQNGCNDTSARVPVVCTGIDEIASLVSFNMRPNPATDVLNVSFELNDVTNVKIAVIDLTGRKIIDVANEVEAKGSHQYQVKLKDITAGIYLLNFVTDSGSFNAKFVKQ